MHIRIEGNDCQATLRPEWIEWVEQCVLSEVYAETVNNGRALIPMYKWYMTELK